MVFSETQDEQLLKPKTDATAPQIVKPSSLNYKISLVEAAIAFSKKDQGSEQVIEVELEEPVTKTKVNLDALDDALYSISKAGLQ